MHEWIYTYIHVCIYIYIYIHTHMVHIHTHTHAGVCIYTYKHTCIQTCARMNICIYIHTHIVYLHIDVPTHIHTDALLTHIHTYTCEYIDTVLTRKTQDLTYIIDDSEPDIHDSECENGTRPNIHHRWLRIRQSWISSLRWGTQSSNPHWILQ